MQPSRAAHTTSAAKPTELGPVVGTELDVDPAQIRDIALDASRSLRSPLTALRILLEGTRAGASITTEFATRALEEIDRAEAAAQDVLAWSMPRKIRSTATTLGEVVTSLRASLDPADRRRTHFVLEESDTALSTDAPLLVESFERSLRHLYRATPGTCTAAATEVMVHVHATGDVATFSFIQTESDAGVPGPASQAAVPTLADALLRASVARLGGKTSIHEAEGHRCAVISLPIQGATPSKESAR